MRRALVLLSFAWLGCGALRTPEEPSALRLDAERAAARGMAASRIRRFAAAAQAYDRAADVFSALDDARAEAAMRHAEGDTLRRAGRLDDAFAAHQRALDLDARAGDGAARARDLAGLAQTLRARGDTARAIATAEEARPLADADPVVAATLDNDLATYLLARGAAADRERIFTLLDAARHSNQARGDRRAVAVNALNLGRTHLVFGDREQAARSAADALEAFRALDDPEGLAQTHELLGAIATARGDATEGRRHYLQARDTFAFLGDEAARRRVEERLAGKAH